MPNAKSGVSQSFLKTTTRSDYQKLRTVYIYPRTEVSENPGIQWIGILQLNFKTMKNFPMALLAASLMLASCSKKELNEIKNEGLERKTAQLIGSFNNYNVFSPHYAHYQEIFVDDRDPDPNQQTLNEAIYYTGYAFKKMIESGSSPTLYSDIAANIDADNELILKNFFDLYQSHYNEVQNITMSDFGVDYAPLVQQPYNVEGEDYGLRIYIPANTLKEEEEKPVIAMAIDLSQPDSTTVVRTHEKGNDYYDDDDFIPCFYTETPDQTYTEATIGYDDFYDDIDKKSTMAQQEIVTALIVVGVVVVVTAAVIWAKGNVVTITNPDPYLGTTNPQSGGGCTKASKFGCFYAKYNKRYNKSGKSKIRYRYYVNHPAAVQVGGNIRTWGDKKFKVGDLKKNEIGSKTFNSPSAFHDDFYLYGYDFLATVKERNQNPQGFSFWVTTYEHDWYASPYHIEYTDAATGMYFVVTERTAKKGEYYQRMLIPNFDWCLNETDKWLPAAGPATLKGVQ